MGTTVTTNLGLIKPDVSEKIKEDLPTYAGWAAQNEINMDKIDALFRDDITNPYTVTWIDGVGTPVVLGAAGFTEGKYIRFLPRMLIGYFRIQCGGAGFVPGTGQYRINCPVAMDPDFLDFVETIPVGRAMFQDNSASLTSSALAVIYSKASNAFVLRPPGGGTWTNTVPVTLAQNDKVSGYFMYPTAVA